MDNTKKWVGWLLAAVIVVVAVVAFATTNQAGEEQNPMVEASEEETAMRKLFPQADAGEAGFALMPSENGGSVYTVNQGGKPAGYVAKESVQGYAGMIDVISGMETSGVLRGIYVGGPEFSETEGLGSKAKEAAFTDQFAGKNLPLELGKNIDGIAGATITSRAVVDGVNSGMSRLDAIIGAKPQTTPGEHQRIANASMIGYAGPVLVRLGLDAGGTITSLSVGGERFLETEGLGSKVREEAFTSQFIGKMPPIEMADIDAVSGATVSSKAVVDAVNEAAKFLEGK